MCFNNPCRDIQLPIAVDKVYNYWSRGLQLSHCIADIADHESAEDDEDDEDEGGHFIGFQ